MLQNKRVDPTRDLVTCPFISARVIVASRLGNHLLKCQKNYPDMDKAKCKFNSDHIVPKHELDHHEANCTYRRNWEHFTQRVGASTCPVTNAVPIHVEVPDSIEDWDNVPVVQNVVSPLDVIQQKIVDERVMRPLAKNGLTKSERKLFTLAEQRRLERLQQEKAMDEERAKAQGAAGEKKDKKSKSDLDSNTPLRLPKT
ncbi:gametocyte-specific factor 1 homolog [Nilaparvata lugens]|uniref:gametocyte-specific factor 1 homolog n=1 Tax=Nilaparvata lugens TaxID=108931 RepID=UPI00193DA9FC|nr:gametocyte-specific factor 1 homolog [Nilaparvata lugens]